MHRKRFFTGILILAALLASTAGPSRAQQPPPPEEPGPLDATAATPLSTTFTYQGRLQSGGAPLDDTCSMAFRLYDDPGSGSLVGSPVTTSVTVESGMFAVELNFGSSASLFNGDARWLDIQVKCSGDGAYTALTPRQPLNPTPYALQAAQLVAFNPNNRGASVGLNWYNDGTNDWPRIRYGGNGEGAENGLLIQGPGNGTRMAILESGDVGIGTSSPVGRLQVSARSTQRAIHLSGGPAIDSTSLSSKWNLPSSSGGSATLSAVAADSDSAAGLGFVVGSNVASPVVWMYASSGRNAFTVARKGYAGTGADISTIDNYLTPLFQVRENGNVGIGTTSPVARLDIAGGSILLDASTSIYGNQISGNRGFIELYNGSSGDMSLGTTFGTGDVAFTAGGSERARILSDGSVGIGTASPASGLEIRREDAGVYLNDATDSTVEVVLRANDENFEIVEVEDTTGLPQSSLGGNAWVTIRDSGSSYYVGIGTTNPGRLLDVAGTARAQVVQITGGSDLAEAFEVSGPGPIVPGSVVSIDPERPGALRVSGAPYDRTVAGCISGANGLNPGLLMQQEGSAASGDYPVAVSGRVYCWADASAGPIWPGDLLTTAALPGHLMRVADYERAQGAVVGKAMSALASGQGLVLVLIALQ